jgi:hypothetical protein
MNAPAKGRGPVPRKWIGEGADVVRLPHGPRDPRAASPARGFPSRPPGDPRSCLELRPAGSAHATRPTSPIARSTLHSDAQVDLDTGALRSWMKRYAFARVRIQRAAQPSPKRERASPSSAGSNPWRPRNQTSAPSPWGILAGHRGRRVTARLPGRAERPPRSDPAPRRRRKMGALSCVS